MNHIAKALKVHVKIPTCLRQFPKLFVRKTLNISFRESCQKRLDASNDLPQPIAGGKRLESLKLTYAILNHNRNVSA